MVNCRVQQILTPLIILAITYDYVIALIQTLYLAITNDWVGQGPHGHPLKLASH